MLEQLGFHIKKLAKKLFVQILDKNLRKLCIKVLQSFL